jgi:hypothetical protein
LRSLSLVDWSCTAAARKMVILPGVAPRPRGID